MKKTNTSIDDKSEKEIYKEEIRNVSAKIKPIRDNLRLAKASLESSIKMQKLLDIEREMESKIKEKKKEDIER